MLIGSQIISMKYNLGRETHENPYHVTVVRQHLTRQLATVFSDMHDELVTAFDELVPVGVHGQLIISARCLSLLTRSLPQSG